VNRSLPIAKKKECKERESGRKDLTPDQIGTGAQRGEQAQRAWRIGSVRDSGTSWQTITLEYRTAKYDAFNGEKWGVNGD